MWKLQLRIDDFELGKSLGQGTVGEIFAAKQRSTGRDVALKILLPTVSQDKVIRSRFEREIVILERLRHPHIIEVLGGGEMGSQLFYAMELVDAGSVKELLQKYERLPWTEVASIAKQVCSALQYAHNHGIIHRDLKPANVFLTQAGSVKLGDFGIARDMRSSELTDQGLTVGTHAYMSPEQITADARMNGKTDLYALGCMLFEMLVGRPPFQGNNFAQLFEQHLRKPAPRVSEFVQGVPPELDDIIHQLLEKNPDDRPFNARQVQGIMIKILENLKLASPATDASAAAAEAETCRVDVGADQTVDPGQAELSHRLKAGRDLEPGSLRAMLVLIAIGLGVLAAGMYLIMANRPVP